MVGNRLKLLWAGPFACSLALLLLLVGAILRCPGVVWHGRIWAEESSVFLAGDWYLSFWRTLVKPQFGYYSLWDNFWTAVAVHCVPLHFVAHLFVGASLLVFLCTGYLVYQAEFLTHPQIRFFAVLALLVTTGDVESWLNLINSEFSFGLWSAVLLCSSPDRLMVRRSIALALAVLSGPITVLLAPFFLLRALRQRTRGAIAQAAVVLAGSGAQFGVAITTHTSNRTLHFTPSILGPILLLKDLLFPLLGRPMTTLLARAMLGHVPVSVVLCWILLGAALAALAFVFRGSPVSVRLLGIALWLGALQALLALGGTLLDAQPGFGERYAYIPNTLLMLSLLVAVTAIRGRTELRVVKALLCLGLCAGVVDYMWLPLRVRSSFASPAWAPQALRWQQDETVPLQASPDDWPALRLSHIH